MNPFTRFYRWLTNQKLTPTEREIVYPLKEELVEKSKLIKVLSMQVNSLEAQLSREKAEKREAKEKIKKEDENRKIADSLFSEKKELDVRRLGRMFSLGAFYRKLYKIGTSKDGKLKQINEFDLRSKWGKNFQIADRNDETSWIFGDILISEKGLLVMKDAEGNIRIISPDIRRFIYKPESILTQPKRGRILMANDKNGNYIPEIDDTRSKIDDAESEIFVPVWNEQKGIYEESEQMRMKARDLVIEKDEQLRETQDKVERQEFTISKLKDEVRDLTRSKVLYESNSKNAQTELSKAIQMTSEMSRESSNMQIKITNLTEYKAYAEAKFSILEETIKNLLEKVKDTGDYTEYRKAQGVFRDAIEMINSIQVNPVLIEAMKEKGQKKQVNVPLQQPQ